MDSDITESLTSSHWGIGVVRTKDGQILSVDGHDSDPDPSALNGNMAGGLTDQTRILRPCVRAGWLKDRTGERGRDGYVELPWDEVLDILAAELTRIRDTHGNEAIFAGSYGWASAGRFHHAQSQLKRFLNCFGGFVRSEGNYSYNAAMTAMPHIVGGVFRQHVIEATRWSVIAEQSDLVVLFGGNAMRNMQICDGGNSRHRMAGNLAKCVANGVQFINLSPLRSDVDPSVKAEWLQPRPGSDTAIMLALCHTLLTENLHDPAFLARYTVGFDRVAAYLKGETDGTPKTADWAASLSGLPSERIRLLARQMAGSRSMVACAAGLQRADWGEQPLWAVVTLAAMLGQIGLPGGGYTIAYGVNGHVGNVSRPFPWGALPQGQNPVKTWLPVTMIAEMLLRPGERFRHNGETMRLPHARLVWWAGGNPFHHHQDLGRLRRAFQTPETIIVNELNWTATARHADIVLPVAAGPERTDFGGGRTDNILVPMPKAAQPPGQARVEYDIYTDLARRLGLEEAFTQGRSEDDWLRALWQETMENGAAKGFDLPDWDSFITGDILEFPDPAPDQVFLAEFRADPDAHPRPTPSGKIELFSQTVAAMDLIECGGHATWNAPRDQTEGTYPLALISGQPGTRLHSQFDSGATSMAQKIAGREPALIHPADAAPRGITTGDVVELRNDRGRCLAGARVTDDVMPGVVFLWTGAWYDPDFDDPHHRDRHGNPNTLTHDLRTSEWTQSPAAHSVQVEMRKLDGPAPSVRAHHPPARLPDPREPS